MRWSRTGRSGSGTTPGTNNPDGTIAYDFNTDETVKFPSTVALVWRWTGDRAFLNEKYDFTVRNLRYVVSKLDADGDGWPEGLGNVERSGMGPEKLDNTVYFIRGLYDLADMAQSKGDETTLRLGDGPGARRCSSASTAHGGTTQRRSTPTRSSSRVTVQSFQKHWIGQTPMEAELMINGQVVPGLAPLRTWHDRLGRA